MNILDIGRRGLGKSTLAAFQASQLNSNQLFFDPGNQFHNVAYKTGDLKELQEELEQWPDDAPVSISYVPPRGNVELWWNSFAATIWDFSGTHEGAMSYVLIIDEAHRIQSPQQINDWLDEFIRRSPRRERGDKNPIDIIQTTHLPQDLFRVSWSESDFVYFFNVFDKRALKAIDEQYGEKIPNVKELVSNLKSPRTGGREVLEIESETGQYRIITNEAEWASDIKTASPPRNTVQAVNRDLGEIYGI